METAAVSDPEVPLGSPGDQRGRQSGSSQPLEQWSARIGRGDCCCWLRFHICNAWRRMAAMSPLLWWCEVEYSISNS